MLRRLRRLGSLWSPGSPGGLGSIGSTRSPGSLGSKVLEVGSRLGIFIIMIKSGGQAADSQKQNSNIIYEMKYY